MINFSKYKAILWDFDGVLIDSMPVREEGFKVVLAPYPLDQVLTLLEYHRQNGGLSRYVKFRYFFETIRGEEISENEVMRLASDFSKVVMERLCIPELLIEDSLTFVRNNYTRLPMHIVSGSDGAELNEICHRLNLTGYFHSILGSPTPKNELVKSIMKNYDYAANELILVGDSINDYEAARINRIDFAGYNNARLISIHPIYIQKFREL